MDSPAAHTRPTRAQKNEATTAALLSAAAQTFAERGFEAATMDEIAERVGLSKGALYYRYRSKEDLFLALLDERCAAYVRRLEGGGDGEAGSNWLSLADGFLAVVREGSWPRLFFEFVSYASRSPRARRKLVARIRSVREAMRVLIERQAESAGVELPLPAQQIALAMSAIGNGLALERLADPAGVADAAFVELPALVLAGAAAGSASR